MTTCTWLAQFTLNVEAVILQPAIIFNQTKMYIVLNRELLKTTKAIRAIKTIKTIKALKAIKSIKAVKNISLKYKVAYVFVKQSEKQISPLFQN